MFFEGHLVRMAEALFYSPYLDPIQVPSNYKEGTWESCNLTKKRFFINWQAEADHQLSL